MRSILCGYFCDIDMISVILIKDKSQKFCISVSIHRTRVSSPLNRNTDCPQSPLHQPPGILMLYILTTVLSFVFSFWVTPLLHFYFFIPKSLLHIIKFSLYIEPFAQYINPKKRCFSTDFSTMPSDVAFKELCESVRNALQTFNLLRTIPTTGIVSAPLRTALNDLVNLTVWCSSFLSV